MFDTDLSRLAELYAVEKLAATDDSLGGVLRKGFVRCLEAYPGGDLRTAHVSFLGRDGRSGVEVAVRMGDAPDITGILIEGSMAPIATLLSQSRGFLVAEYAGLPITRETPAHEQSGIIEQGVFTLHYVQEGSRSLVKRAELACMHRPFFGESTIISQRLGEVALSQEDLALLNAAQRVRAHEDFYVENDPTLPLIHFTARFHKNGEMFDWRFRYASANYAGLDSSVIEMAKRHYMLIRDVLGTARAQLGTIDEQDRRRRDG